MSKDTTEQTRATFEHHLKAIFAKDVDAIMEDFAEDAVLFTPDGLFRGAGEVREFFIGFVANLTPEMLADFSATRQEFDGEIAYLVWTIGDIIPLGTDTFVVRNGKIVTQTFAMYAPS